MSVDEAEAKPIIEEILTKPIIDEIETKPTIENDQFSEENQTDSTSNVSENKPLTFKDWKSLKESQKKSDDKSSKNNKISNYKNANGQNNNVAFNRGSSFRGAQNFFARTSFGNNFNNFMPQFDSPSMGLNNFNNNNFNNNNFNNNFNNNNNNHFNRGFNNMLDGRNNFSNGVFNNCNNNFRGPNNSNNIALPNNFFASDGMFRQRDMLQDPLSNNPFRNERKGNELLNKLKNLEFAKPIKKKRQDDKPKGDMRKQSRPVQERTTIGAKPIVYVPNPKSTNIDEQPPFIPKPIMPEDNPNLTMEEKKQQWKEYREAMKPFKNRNFYNARRVVQRLGKKEPKDLDDKEIIRLANAREIMAAHKQRISAKYPNYIKDKEYSEELGELYILQKKPTQKEWNNRKEMMPNNQQNYGNFGNNSNFNNGFGGGQKLSNNSNINYEPGRKIVGGYSGYGGFLSGGIMKGSEQTFKY